MRPFAPALVALLLLCGCHGQGGGGNSAPQEPTGNVTSGRPSGTNQGPSSQAQT